MQTSINPGRLDWVLLFYYPTKLKDSIGATTTTMIASSRKIKAERIFKNSQERMEASQQVGISTISFRMPDVRKNGLQIDYQWEFDAYSISNVGVVKRFKVTGIEDEGRKNHVIITGQYRDNG